VICTQVEEWFDMFENAGKNFSGNFVQKS